jgi:hypothetical protein
MLKQDLKDRFAMEKEALGEKLSKQGNKKETLEKEVEAMKKELEKVNANRNALYSAIGKEERTLMERESEKN